MDQKRIDEVARLAEIAFNAAEKERVLGMINTSGESADVRRAGSIEYAVARAQAFEAYAVLDRYIRGIPEPDDSAQKSGKPTGTIQ